MAQVSKSDFGVVYFDNGIYYVERLITWDKLLDRSNFLYWNDNIQDYDYLMSQIHISKLKSIKGSTFLITGNYVGRPDKLALDMFGDADYWWVLMLYNGIENFDELVEGYKLQVAEKRQLNNWLADMYFEFRQAGELS